MIKRKNQATVFAMMSGGVDSSIAAALLHKRGFNVVGVFMKNWEGRGECQWIDDERDARKVAAKIGIPFYVMNFEEEYRRRVFDPFIQGIKQGITPNPDVFCNTYIKFGIFLEKALALGADYVATGHYARVARKCKVQSAKCKMISQNSKLLYKLIKARDIKKDQTYFLYRFNQFQLSKTMFPIGNYIKSEVRAMAKEFGLATYNKPDSQGICFVGQAPFDDFIAQYIPRTSGAIVNTKGETIGTHKGVAFYTIGQRRGLGIGGVAEPLYVAKKDTATNTLIATHERDPLLYTKNLRAVNVNWIAGMALDKKELRVKARFRHQQELQPCRITQMEADEDADKRGYANLRKSAAQSAQIRVQFERRQRAITPGQSIVFYKKQEVLGGGIIV